MAIYITSSDIEKLAYKYIDPDTNPYIKTLGLIPKTLSGTITIEFDPFPTSTDFSGMPLTGYNYISEKRYAGDGSTTEYKTTKLTTSFNADDFKTKSDGSVNYVAIGWTLSSSIIFFLGGPRTDDVYLNGVKTGYSIDVPNLLGPTLGLAYDDFPVSVEVDDITIQENGWNGYAVGGDSVLQISNIKVYNTRSDTPNVSRKVSVSIAGRDNNKEYSLTQLSEDTWQLKNIYTLSSEEQSSTLTISVTGTNNYKSLTITKSITIYPYHLPRLFLNRTGEVSYVSRCQQDGTADGLGSYGHLHLVWDVSPINTTGSGIINTLQSAVVVLNDTTTLSPSGGSIASGYLDYIFPLAQETQGNLTITLTDTRKSNTITGLNVPKGSMPLSMYDDGSNIGVAFGCMATDKGAWMYMPFYLQSSTSGSTKMFRLCIDDNGNITAKAV